MKAPYRPYPEFNFPLPRFQEQYQRLVELAGVADKMCAFGVGVDTGKALAHAEAAAKRAIVFSDMFLELTKLPREALGNAGEGNTLLVKDWFKDAGAPDVIFDKRTKKPQFNAAAMTCWSSDYVGRPFAAPAAALLGLRKSKTGARFARSYFEVASRHDGRIHFDFNILGTKGERWSSSARFRWKNPDDTVTKISLNAQNVPAKTIKYDFGPGRGVQIIAASLRDCFIPGPNTVWAKFDYEGAEAALIAHYTQDALMLEWLNTGADFHTENAKLMFLERGIAADLHKLEKTHPAFECRIAAKPATFGLAYQMPLQRKQESAPHDVYKELWKNWKQMFPNLSETYFGVCIDRYWAGHGGIRAWQHAVCARVAQDGFIALPQSGKTLYVANTAKGRNMSGNFFMQSGIGFLINRAMPPVAARCDWQPNGLALLFPVHDELDLQVPIDRLDEVCAFVSEEMSRPADFDGHIAGVQAAPDVGDSWGTCQPYKGAVDGKKENTGS